MDLYPIISPTVSQVAGHGQGPCQDVRNGQGPGTVTNRFVVARARVPARPRAFVTRGVHITGSRSANSHGPKGIVCRERSGCGRDGRRWQPKICPQGSSRGGGAAEVLRHACFLPLSPISFIRDFLHPVLHQQHVQLAEGRRSRRGESV